MTTCFVFLLRLFLPREKKRLRDTWHSLSLLLSPSKLHALGPAPPCRQTIVIAFSCLCLSSHQHRIPNSNSSRPSPRALYPVRTMDTRGTERRARVLLLMRGQLNRPQDTLDPNATPSSSACFLFLVFILTSCHSTRMGMRMDKREGESQAEQKLSSNFHFFFFVVSQTSLCRR